MARVAALYRYPVKGFTPERRPEAMLQAGGFFPCDRLYAVENGPSGFDPDAPAFIPKTRFTVLARIPKVAKARTAYDEETGIFTVETDGTGGFAGDLRMGVGRAAFAAWLTDFLAPEEVNGPLQVLSAPGHAFTDSPGGFVSIVNLASVRDLETRLGRPVDPLRFRANIYVEGLAPWVELDWAEGAAVRLGDARAGVLKPIVRCVATHVDPMSGERDMEIVPTLHALYGHVLCGVYLNILESGCVREGDPLELEA
jgi:uncharacterized protein YcbX